MKRTRFYAILIIAAAIAIGYFVYVSEFNGANNSPVAQAYPSFVSTSTPASSWVVKYPLKFGLDLRGGTHLIYKADTTNISASDRSDIMTALRDVVERRINIFGVSEPLIQVETRGSGDGREDRLIVELPGVTNITQALAVIGQTPVLEFKTERPNGETQKIIDAQQQGERLTEDPFLVSELTGRFLKRASVEFVSNSMSPAVMLQFTPEGQKIFADLTKKNVGKVVAIYLDGSPISTPVVREEIKTGSAQISGTFTPQEAKQLAGRLNSGALPVPIELVSTQTIGASLGGDALKRDIEAGVIGFLVIAAFLVLWYRFPGFVAIFSLGIYVLLTIALFKLIPVVLTSAGIAGFILSIGMAVDANILIFERTKEELKKGLSVDAALREGFHRAWPSIRDSNVSSMITAVVLFWMGSSMVKGFALTFGLGVVVSLFTAITVTRTFLYCFRVKDTGFVRFLFSNGLSK